MDLCCENIEITLSYINLETVSLNVNFVSFSCVICLCFPN